MENIIEFSDFQKVDMRIGEVLSAKDIDGSENLLKLEVDFGDIGKRQVLSGIKKWFSADDLVGKQYVFATNIKPRKMMGLESQAMILAVDKGDDVILIAPCAKVENGEKIS